MIRRFILPAVLILLSTMAARAQWWEADGIYGHDLSSVTSYNGITFVGTRSGGLFRSSEGRFVPLRNGLPIGWIEAIIGDRKGTLYAGVRDDGTYSSTDNGASWRRIDVVGSLRSLKRAGSWVFLATDRAFYRVSDLSGTFEPILETFGQDLVFALETDIRETTVFAGSFMSVLRSTDYGLTWDRIPLPDSSHFPVGVTDLVRTPAGITAVAMRYRFLSTDNGLSFSAIQDEREPMVMRMIGDGERLIAALDDGLYTSTDGSRSFAPLLDENGEPFFDIAGRDTLVAITSQKLFTSVDRGASWSSQTPIINAQSVVALAASPSDLFAASDLLYRSNDGGRTFTQAGSDTAAVAIRDVEIGDSWMFALAGPFTLLRSSNRGESWQNISGVIGDSGLPVAAMHVDGSTILAATHFYGIYYSSDNGDTWSVSGAGDPSGVLSEPHAFASFNGRIYLATRNYLLESQDRGATWNAVPGVVTNSSIMAMVADRDYLYAATSTQTYRLGTDGGWTTGGPLVEPTSFVVAPNGVIYAGTAGLGVMMSQDQGRSWRPFESPISAGFLLSGNSAIIYDLEISGIHLVAATGSNVWTTILPELIDAVRADPGLPHDMVARYDSRDHSLHLTFSLLQPGDVVVELVDLRGIVLRKFDAVRIAGATTTRLQLDPLPDGHYFVTVRGESGMVAVPVTIVRR